MCGVKLFSLNDKIKVRDNRSNLKGNKIFINNDKDKKQKQRWDIGK